ncbi:conserved hypothetical protein [Phenylobacterium zucineum HLK1]|uniref:HTH iclR-type domain-containing protein n=2 Tax=Phenylobacterium zucineum TaxID=284016 RepID=B4RDR3_PHEZH|nr:conserved hypothetical protein [Phenylobacterium zucineum HLK1]
MPPPTAEIAPGGAPARAVWRLIGTYMLRVAEELSRVGHLMDGIILFEVFRSNTEHWPPEVRGEEGTTAADMVPDTMRRPVTPGGVARRLGLPPETVRRHALRLVDRGLLARVPGGLILPAETLARQNVFPALAANAANLQRMMGALSQLGVLRLWDAEEAGDHGQEHAAAVG